jgi:hypothetical protein
MTKDEPEVFYKAEKTALWPVSSTFHSTREIQAFVNDVTNSDLWFLQTTPTFVPDIEVLALRDGTTWLGCADVDAGIIHIRNKKLCVVLHELAHVAAAQPSHDLHFARIMLALVREYMGFFVYIDFKYVLSQTKEFRNV